MIVAGVYGKHPKRVGHSQQIKWRAAQSESVPYDPLGLVKQSRLKKQKVPIARAFKVPSAPRSEMIIVWTRTQR